MSVIADHHKYLSSHETRKHRHIFAGVAAFWQRVFQTLPNLDVHPGVAVYHTLKIFTIVNAKDLLMPHTKFQVCTLKINTIFCLRKKIPLLLNRSNQRNLVTPFLDAYAGITISYKLETNAFRQIFALNLFSTGYLSLSISQEMSTFLNYLELCPYPFGRTPGVRICVCWWLQM